MSNITKGIEKLAEDSAIKDGHPKSDKEQFTTTFWTQHNIYFKAFVKGYKAALQNKVSDISAEEVINGGQLEKNGWHYLNTNFYAKGRFAVWKYDKWNLEISPKLATKKAIILVKDIRTITEINRAIEIADKTIGWEKEYASIVNERKENIPERIFFIDEVRKLLVEFNKEEMSLSRFVEILNEKATGINAIDRFKQEYQPHA